MKKETIVIILLCVLLVAEAAALVIQNRRYNALMAAYREAAARNSGQNRTAGDYTHQRFGRINVLCALQPAFLLDSRKR